MCVAATGLGKSLLFEGTAKLVGKGQMVFVICPLKSLERDQMLHAQEKGPEALAIDEDTEKSPKLWEQLRTTAQIVYLSPEMVLSDTFQNKVWKDTQIHRRLGAVSVDEAHCIDEQGEDDFQPQYRQLSTIRPLCGYDVPFIACTRKGGVVFSERGVF
ncbi:hypothetical protein K435DRAFT_102975 [Dendrothele bispora CBS 962.96]|uniref:DNA 3'-5' helicase n=1 Tax=Dendrothele bispora (strain CBS 962.96) TaxID=1314807 RepID=A0A4S8KNH0_DENBC|nr:hypothetical protein K435DRAFT_102975 [Dendrothele bispora CBS 962.96]